MEDKDIWDLEEEPLETKELTEEEKNYLNNFADRDLFRKDILPMPISNAFLDNRSNDEEESS